MSEAPIELTVLARPDGAGEHVVPLDMPDFLRNPENLAAERAARDEARELGVEWPEKLGGGVSRALAALAFRARALALIEARQYLADHGQHDAAELLGGLK